MGQERNNIAHRGEIMHILPKASTAITSGDYVVMPRNIDPISRAVLGAESRISPIGSAWSAQWGVGIVDSDFTTNTVGATKYATPTSNEALPVIRRGVVRLAIVQTSGQAGDLVVYSSGATGAQLFAVNNFRRDIAVGRIFKTFSGATANDTQLVELIEKPISERDIYYWLQNRVIEGCAAKMHSVANQRSSQINMGATGEPNRVIIKGKVQSLARVTDFIVNQGTSGLPGASDLKAYWIAVKVSTTGSALAWTKETCTIAALTKIASYTGSGVSAGCFVPITWTSNMVPVALVLAFSATAVSFTPNKIMNIRSPQLPWGNRLADQTKWYL